MCIEISFVNHQSSPCTRRVGITVCKWLFQALHDIEAISTFDYILPLMPELFRFAEGSKNLVSFDNLAYHPGTVNDNDELSSRADLLLVRMCGVTPPRSMVGPILNAIFEAIQSAPVSLLLNFLD